MCIRDRLYLHAAERNMSCERHAKEARTGFPASGSGCFFHERRADGRTRGPASHERFFADDSQRAGT
eukprot:6714255-Alexandrium_andersonii.AAC.1